MSTQANPLPSLASIRIIAVALMALALVAIGGPARAQAAAVPERPALASITLGMVDMDTSLQFYRDALGMTLLDRHVATAPSRELVT